MNEGAASLFADLNALLRFTARTVRRRVKAGELRAEREPLPTGFQWRVILDGETFRAEIGRPIFLKLAQPLSFVRIAA